MTDDYLFTHDAATVSYDSVETSGITVDDGVASFDWNEIPVVELDEPPHKRAFDTDKFYKIEGATVARPIKQPYMVGDEVEWYKKPADELRDLAWSLDNAPYTLGHPDTGMVKRTEDVHGFWKNPRYVDDEDRLKEDLYIPYNDDEAKDFVEENQDVSIGFYNRVHSEYDGDTGDLTDDDVDGFQVNMYGDHVAGVERGRCSGEDGCGLDGIDDHGEVVLETDDPTVEADVAESDDSATESDTQSDKDGEDGDSDNADDGGDGDTEEDCTCSDQRSDSCADSDESETPCTDTTMGDSDDNKFDISVDLNDVTLDSLAEQFDAVADLREERDDYKETVDEVREDLDEHGFDVDDDECPCEVVDDVLHEYEDLEGEVDDLEDELEDYRADEKEEALDELVELNADRDEWEDEDLDDIREEIDRREEVLDGIDADTKGLDTDSGTDEGTDEGETTVGGRRRFGRGHNADPQA